MLGNPEPIHMRRPGVVTLGGVVEHDGENDLDTGQVQCLDYVAKLVHRSKRIPARALRPVPLDRHFAASPSHRLDNCGSFSSQLPLGGGSHKVRLEPELLLQFF